MLTIDEFIKKNGMVKTRADVYLLMKLGALKTVKKGKRRYVVINNDTNIDIEKIKEKRNRKFSFHIPEVLYKKFALIELKKKSNMIDVALKTLESIIERNCKDTDSRMPLTFTKEQIMKAMHLEEKIEEIRKKVKMVKRFKIGRYTKRNFFFIFFFLMCFADVLEYEKPIYEKEKEEVKHESHGIKA